MTEPREWLREDAEHPVAPAEDLEFHVDGAAYMARWRSLALDCASEGGQIVHNAWRIADVPLLGVEERTTGLYRTVKGVADSGGEVFVRLSGHVRLAIGAPVRLRSQGVFAFNDYALPARTGSFHEKFTVFSSTEARRALIGSIDLNKRRWDTEQHLLKDESRPAPRRLSHDVGLELGGLIADRLHEHFCWQWAFYCSGFDAVLLSRAVSAPQDRSPWRRSASGSMRVRPGAPPSDTSGASAKAQVLFTKSPCYTRDGYPVDIDVDQSLYQSFVRAVHLARTYIYVEDQYWCPYTHGQANAQMEVLQEALEDAVERGVQIIVLVPGRSDRLQLGPLRRYQQHDRDLAVARLLAAADGRARAAAPIVATRWSGARPVYVHSKLLLVDDEFLLIGSANVNVRSFFNDLEASVAVAGPGFGRQMRNALWSEHLGVSMDDVSALEAIEQWRQRLSEDAGAVRPYHLRRRKITGNRFRPFAAWIDPHVYLRDR